MTGDGLVQVAHPGGLFGRPHPGRAHGGREGYDGGEGGSLAGSGSGAGADGGGGPPGRAHGGRNPKGGRRPPGLPWKGGRRPPQGLPLPQLVHWPPQRFLRSPLTSAPLAPQKASAMVTTVIMLGLWWGPRCHLWRLTLLGLLLISGSVLGTFCELGQEDIRGTDAGAVGGRALGGDNGVCQADSLCLRMVRWPQFPAYQRSGRHEPRRLERVQLVPLLRAARRRRKGPSFCYVLLIMY